MKNVNKSPNVLKFKKSGLIIIITTLFRNYKLSQANENQFEKKPLGNPSSSFED